MFKTTITPRFKDTDMLGHINNASIATWFEEARRPIFLLFNPTLNRDVWNLILRKMDIDFMAEGSWQDEVQIETKVVHVGNTSFQLLHEAKQLNKTIASSKEVLVCFDYKEKVKKSISKELVEKLNAHV